MGIELTVNGRASTVDCDPETPLLYVLRNDLELTGTRFGCGTGACGACTVVMDGAAVRSCDVPLSVAAGKRITTVEGLAEGEDLHPLQRAFIDEQAVQCGFCLSGILMSAKALLDATPHPSEADIRRALDGNLCRCGTHVRILRAVRAAASAR
ncbi:MAG TPA: (2Fe-2S)-binding protein [Candidatus Limnocylindria bacterium]